MYNNRRDINKEVERYNEQSNGFGEKVTPTISNCYDTDQKEAVP
jgi:hypothetical protein